MHVRIRVGGRRDRIPSRCRRRSSACRSAGRTAPTARVSSGVSSTRQRRLAGVERGLDLRRARRPRRPPLLSPRLASLASRSRRFFTDSRSASISSVLMTSMSRTGSIVPDDVMDVGVLEAADDLHDGVDLADVRQELVARALRPGSRLSPGRRCRRTRSRPGMTTLVLAMRCSSASRASGTVTMPTFGIDGAERIVGRLRLARAGDGVEQRGLAHVGQPDDSGSQHDVHAGYQRSQHLRVSRVARCVSENFFNDAWRSASGTSGNVLRTCPNSSVVS